MTDLKDLPIWVSLTPDAHQHRPNFQPLRVNFPEGKCI